jgi:hypothetical protein
MINAFVTTFSGLPNVNLVLPPSAPLSELFSALYTRLSISEHPNLVLSTISGHRLSPTSSPLNSVTDGDYVSLRLTSQLCGGKGGFGSQLRAAGGRMSSRKKSQENSDSCRNLDGRRLRTVKEAKALAALLEVKPEMDKKQKEAAIARWKEVIEGAKRHEEGGDKKRFDDVEWLESLEGTTERTREACLVGLKALGLVAEDSSGESSGDEEEDVEDPSDVKGKKPVLSRISEVEERKPVVVRKFAGWEEEDESSDEEEA